MDLTLEDLTEPSPPDEELAPLDRSDASPADELQEHWREHGWILLPSLLPDELLDAYVQAWLKVNNVRTGKSRWPECAYMHLPAVMDLCLYEPLVDALGPLVGGKVGLHLCLTGWRSTTRDWHQDDYLNPPAVNSWYAAAWIALADIHPDAGPFQYIDGSHRWPRLRRHKVLRALDLDASDPAWPSKTERYLTKLVEHEIERRGATPTTADLRKGDVLIWHGCLYHRGTRPRNPTLERRVCIAHYSAVQKRWDMQPWEPHGDGFYFANEQPMASPLGFLPGRMKRFYLSLSRLAGGG